MSELSELKDIIESKGRAWEELKATVNTLHEEMKSKRTDPLLNEKIDKINASITESNREKKRSRKDSMRLRQVLRGKISISAAIRRKIKVPSNIDLPLKNGSEKAGIRNCMPFGICRSKPVFLLSPIRLVDMLLFLLNLTVKFRVLQKLFPSCVDWQLSDKSVRLNIRSL
jgi:hypothetical protein